MLSHKRVNESPMPSLTDKQATLLNVVKEFTDEFGFPPTRAELGEVIGIWPTAVQARLQGLQKKGYISIEPHKSRSIRVLNYA